MASINFDTDVISSLAGYNTTENGIAKGYASGNLGYVADKYGGVSNDGEFTVTGTSFTPNKLVVASKYYYANSGRVAMRQAGTLYFLFGDHLGSTSITVNRDGGDKRELRYKPWGGTRYSSGDTPTTYQFTGQRKDSSGVTNTFDRACSS